ncbi:hypothetical protein [Rhizobium sp. BK491]|uniref:hypothetical protein n=1 Tax=Rhizobium sp. BK491 TaxID=2587009 RepID=UPI00180A9B4C|nr:hypothetical protein [Rhizobium sp. BK491]MBB3571605.1 hypothetical protein [Rhizobium sp. BK491]
MLVLNLQADILQPEFGIVLPQGVILGPQCRDVGLQRVQLFDKAADEPAHRHQRQRLDMLNGRQWLLAHSEKES